MNLGKEILQFANDNFQPPIICYVSEVTVLGFAHVTSFLLKVTHLVTGEFDDFVIFGLVESAIKIFDSIAGKYYAKLLQRMLDQVRSQRLEVDTWQLDPGIAGLIDWDAMLGGTDLFAPDAF